MSAAYVRDVARGMVAGMLATSAAMGALYAGASVGASPWAAATPGAGEVSRMGASTGNFNPGAALDTSQVEHGPTCRTVAPTVPECVR